MSRNLCMAAVAGRMSCCGGMNDDERGGCEFFFPAGPWSNGCMHYRPEFGGHCDNLHAQIAAAKQQAVRNETD